MDEAVERICGLSWEVERGNADKEKAGFLGPAFSLD